MQLFHYHLVTSRVRQVEARYVGKLAFELVARHGRIGDDYQSFPAGISWEELDRMGFKLRLSELERGAVNVVVQPGQWELPRVDHLGLALDEEEFADVIDRAVERELRIQAHGGRRTFIATNAGYRLEVHPPREWLDELLGVDRRPRRSASCTCSPTSPRPRRSRSPSCSSSSGTGRASTWATRSCASSPAGRRAGRSSTPSC